MYFHHSSKYYSGLGTENTAVGIRCADHERTLALTSATSGGLLVGTVRWWAEATEFFNNNIITFYFYLFYKSLDIFYGYLLLQ
jgi:hypothetical protein